MKFVLKFDKSNAHWQYSNLKKWLEENSIEHRFEWTDTGHWIPQIIVIDGEDATLFSLTMKHSIEKNTV